jgi:hypothetical protein
MSNEAVYTGEDMELILEFHDINFADLQDVIVGVVVGKELKKTCKKSSGTDALKVLAVAGEPTQCKFRLFRSETKTWASGPMAIEATQVFADAGFPDGKHTPFKIIAPFFENLYTKNS